MTGEAHWMDAVLMLVGAGAILLYIWRAGRIDSFLLRERLRFVCPVLRTSVGATVLEDVRSDHLTDIKRCSGWRHFWAPCQKSCLAPLNDGTIKEESLHLRRRVEPHAVTHPPASPYRP